MLECEKITKVKLVALSKIWQGEFFVPFAGITYIHHYPSGFIRPTLAEWVRSQEHLHRLQKSAWAVRPTTAADGA